MAKKKKTSVGEPERIFDWSGGMNNAVNPALLNDNESVLLQNYTLDEKGTLFPAKGVQDRYVAPFWNSPVAGMGPFYKSDGTTRLLIGTEDGKLYVDTPHLVNSYDTQGEFNSGQYQAAVSTSDGKIWPMVVSTGFEDGYWADFHTRDSGWTIDDTVYKTGSKSAKGTGTNQKLVRELGFNVSQLYMKLACRFAETNQVHYPVILLSPSGSQIQAVVAASDGHFKYHNGSALANFPTDKTYAKDTWYVVEVWVRGGTFWVSIDGQGLTPDGLTMKDTANAAQSQVAKVQIQNAGSTAATMWVDDVEINALAAVFSRASVAYKQDGQQVAANVPRFEQGQFGQAIVAEEGTTNLCLYSEELNNAAWQKQNMTVTANATTAPNGTVTAERLTATAGVTSYIRQPFTVTAGVSYTISAFVKRDNNERFKILAYDTVNSVNIVGGQWGIDASGNIATAIIQIGLGSIGYENIGSGWWRIWLTFTTPSTGLDVYLYVDEWSSSSKGLSGYYWGIQVEQKAYKTTYVKTTDASATRSPETLTIPTAGVLNPQEGTIECWVYVNSNLKENSDSRFIFDARDGAEKIFLVHYNGTYQFVTGRSAPDETVVSFPDTDLPDGWHLFAARWSSSEIALFVDGVKKVSATNPILAASVNTARIGNRYNATTGYCNTLIDPPRISSRARTDEEIAAAYASGQPLPVDADTTYKLNFDNNLNVQATHAWVSPVIDASNATDKASGHVALTADIPDGSTISIQSRSAPASTGPWTAWVNALADGTLQHTPDNFIQVRLVMSKSGDDDPDVDKLVVSFDGQASTTLLADDFTAGGQFFFGQLTDYLAVVNGLDAPRKYDGATLEAVGGSPPHASYIAAHKNRLWLAKGSRLYFSDLLNIDSWPVLNFIDIMPQDGDTITGLLTYGDYLIISKQHSMWMLTGEGINTFQVRRIHADKGAYAPRSLCIVNQMLCFISDDGIYFSDFTQPVLASERMRQTWAGLNKRRLNLAASWFTEHKLYVAVPNGTSQRNNLVIVYDALRQAFAGIFTGWNVSCWTDFREAGEINSYFGCSDTGQVKQINAGYNNAGQAYTAEYRSKEFSFGVPEVLKRWNKVYLQVKPASLAANLEISFIVDGKETPSMTVNVPADADGFIHTLLVLASKVGVIAGHRLGMRIRQNVLDNPVGIQTVYIESMPTLVKPTIWS